jgi:hypothetical protein
MVDCQHDGTGWQRAQHSSFSPPPLMTQLLVYPRVLMSWCQWYYCLITSLQPTLPHKMTTMPTVNIPLSAACDGSPTHFVSDDLSTQKNTTWTECKHYRLRRPGVRVWISTDGWLCRSFQKKFDVRDYLGQMKVTKINIHFELRKPLVWFQKITKCQ